MRILTSRLFCGLVAALLIVSESRWQTISPVAGAMFFFVGLFLVAIASLGRLWCALYIAGRKSRELVTVGPYSITRNPLYAFSFLGAVGVGLASEMLSVTAVLAAGFLIYYPFVVKAEEKKLHLLFPDRFSRYVKEVPRFWPRRWHIVEPDGYEVDTRVFRRHIASALWFVWSVGILEILEGLHTVRAIPVCLRLL
jgi:protein-S-isoprenylcysteine O-methyltransferase Ste14